MENVVDFLTRAKRLPTPSILLKAASQTLCKILGQLEDREVFLKSTQCVPFG